MENVKVESTISHGNVFVRCGDIVKALYADLSDIDDPMVQKYIIDSIKKWEKYEKNILFEYNHM